VRGSVKRRGKQHSLMKACMPKISNNLQQRQRELQCHQGGVIVVQTLALVHNIFALVHAQCRLSHASNACEFGWPSLRAPTMSLLNQ